MVRTIAAMDYRVLSGAALLLWGAWGYLSKVLASRGCPAVVIAFWATLAGVVPIAIYAGVTGTLRWHRLSPLAILAGLAAGVATVCFYFALHRGPASVVVPMSGMYIVIPALLGYLLLGEPFSWKHLAGLVCAGLAVLLLSF